MFKLALCTLVFGGYALASGGGGDYSPPVYYKYSYDCKASGTDLTVSMKTVDTGFLVQMSEIQISGTGIQVKFHTDDYYRYKTEERFTEFSKGMPASLFKGDFVLRENGSSKEFSGHAQYRDANHHIGLFSKQTNTLSAIVYDLHTGSPIYNEKLKCTLKIESYEGN